MCVCVYACECVYVCECAISHFLLVEDVGYMSQPSLSDKTWCIAGYLSPGSCIFTPCLPLGKYMTTSAFVMYSFYYRSCYVNTARQQSVISMCGKV